MKHLISAFRFDSPFESFGRIFATGLGAALGATATLYLLGLLISLEPGLDRYFGTETAFRAVVLIWAAIVPAWIAARTRRPYILLAALTFALLGLGGGPVTFAIFAVLIIATYYWAASRRPRK